MKPSKKEPEHWLGDLNPTTRLVATTQAFLIRKFTKPKDGSPGQWQTRYFYTSLKDALQGYVKRTLRGERVSGVQGDLQKLMEAVQSLEKEVAQIGDKLNMEWKAKNG